MPMIPTPDKLPESVQSFRTLREEGYMYFDKTTYISMLMRRGQYYFLCRPPHYGKSLLVSTLAEWLRGNAGLFEGLKYYPRGNKQHCVIALDLSACGYACGGSLDGYLRQYVRKWGVEQGELYAGLDPQSGVSQLAGLIQVECRQGRQVAVLIDNYDSPLLSASGGFIRKKEQLSALFDMLKAESNRISFMMVVGETPIAESPVGGSLEWMTDISRDMKYQSICGFTMDEAQQLCNAMQLQPSILDECQCCYFSDNKDDVKMLSPHEVCAALRTGVVAGRPLKRDKVRPVVSRMLDMLERGKVDSFMELMQAVIASPAYMIVGVGNYEKSYHLLFHTIALLLGHPVESESMNIAGRLDMTLRTRHFIYIFEFKLDGSAEEALQQIEEKGYALKYRADGRRIIKVGANFSRKTHTLERWEVSRDEGIVND